ncbi:hypothetical protein ACXWOI_09410, partial [Streptococcus pyogenes]
RDFLNMFKYIPEFQMPDFKGFWYSGGPTKLGTIKLGSTPSDIDAFNLQGTQSVLNIATRAIQSPAAVMTYFIQAKNTIDLSLKSAPHLLDFT